MAKVKYYYDSDSLSYKKIKHSKAFWLRKALFYAVGVFWVMIVGYFGISYFLESPKEKEMARELDYMRVNASLIDKKMKQFEEVLTDVQERDNKIYRSYFEINPLSDEQRRAGFGGVNRYKNLEGYENSDLIIELNKKMDVLSKQLVIQSRSLDDIVKMVENEERLLKSIPAIQPVENKDLKRIASGFGFRIDPFTKAHKFHKGMDFSAKRGAPVYATGNGIVKRADNLSSGYGKHIRIDHGFGYITLYAHLDKYNVKLNKRVKRGDIIGFVGSTGRSKAPHLHYEVRKNGKVINPVNFYYGDLTSEEFVIMQKVSGQEGQSMD